MSYQVRKNKVYQIVEKDTELVVYQEKSERKARDVCRSLNLGSGFAGFTPIFFVGDWPKEKATNNSRLLK